MQNFTDATLPVSPNTKAQKNDLSQLKKIVRDIGLKVTSQRLVILERLVAGKDHVTAQQLFEDIAPKAPDIGFATVYRFLKTLAEHRYVTEVRMRGLPARYEWATKSHHDHLTCSSCGKICEFENEQIEKIQKEIAAQFGFELTDHILELYGICMDCRIPKNSKILPPGKAN